MRPLLAGPGFSVGSYTGPDVSGRSAVGQSSSRATWSLQATPPPVGGGARDRADAAEIGSIRAGTPRAERAGMASLRSVVALVFVTLAPLACAADDDAPAAATAPTLETQTEDARALQCDRSAYNCRVPNYENHSDPNRKFNDYDGTYFWGVTGTPELKDGTGHVRGHVLSTEGHAHAVKLDFGERKVIGGVTHVYAFSAHLDTGSASGWIPESAIVRQNTLKQMPTIAPRKPSEGFYETDFVVTGGDLASDHQNLELNEQFGDRRVNPNVTQAEHASDYLVRQWDPESHTGFVNFLFNLPHSGGVTTDTLPMCTHFKRFRGVDELTTDTYFTGSPDMSKLKLHFVFGEIDGRRGWMTHEMLTPASDLDKLDANHPCRVSKTAPSQPLPPSTPPVSCHVTCCGGGAGNSDTTEASASACVDRAQTFCAASGHVQSAIADGASAYTRAGSSASLRCWAKCANRTDYHEVEGVTEGCDARAEAYCAEGDRGDLEDAQWNRCDVN